MANIHTATQEGRVTKLGPVKVKKLWPYKAGDKSINGVFIDDSGEIPFKIWGATPKDGIYEGASVILVGTGPKGGINHKEYPAGSDKWALNASECRVEVVSGTGSHTNHDDAPEPEYGARKAYHENSSQDKVAAVAKQAAKCTAAYIDELVVNHGFSKDEAIMLAQNASGLYPLFWFGEKGV